MRDRLNSELWGRFHQRQHSLTGGSAA